MSIAETVLSLETSSVRSGMEREVAITVAAAH
jgi:hypothetical protein